MQEFLAAIGRHKPGDQVKVTFKGRTGTKTTSMTLKEDPALEAVLLEDTGATPTPEQKAFRAAWLGSRAGS